MRSLSKNHLIDLFKFPNPELEIDITQHDLYFNKHALLGNLVEMIKIITARHDEEVLYNITTNSWNVLKSLEYRLGGG